TATAFYRRVLRLAQESPNRAAFTIPASFAPKNLSPEAAPQPPAPEAEKDDLAKLVGEPPPPNSETPPPAPSAETLWLPGFWSWLKPQQKYTWHEGRWVGRESPTPPPEAMIREAPQSAPSASMFWVDGIWCRDANHFTWRSGHWERRRPGYEYVPARWEA